MPNITILPAVNSPHPPCSLTLSPSNHLTVSSLRKCIAEKYYVTERQILLIFKGAVLTDEMSLDEIGIKDNSRVSVSINCPKIQKEERKIETQEQIEELTTPPTTFHTRTTKTFTPFSPSKNNKQPPLPHTHSPKHSPSQPLEDQEELQSPLQSAVSNLILSGGSSALTSMMSNIMMSKYKIPPETEIRQKYEKQLIQLKEMGVCTPQNQKICLKELYLNKGNVSGAIYYIVESQ